MYYVYKYHIYKMLYILCILIFGLLMIEYGNIII